MKINCILPNVKVLNVEKKTSQDGSINWTEIVLFSESNCNTVTCDNKLADSLKVGGSYDLILNIDEKPKAYRNGSGAYLEHKFKITGLISK